MLHLVPPPKPQVTLASSILTVYPATSQRRRAEREAIYVDWEYGRGRELFVFPDDSAIVFAEGVAKEWQESDR